MLDIGKYFKIFVYRCFIAIENKNIIQKRHSILKLESIQTSGMWIELFLYEIKLECL